MVAIVVKSDLNILLSPTVTLPVAPLGTLAVPTVLFKLFLAFAVASGAVMVVALSANTFVVLSVVVAVLFNVTGLSGMVAFVSAGTVAIVVASERVMVLSVIGMLAVSPLGTFTEPITVDSEFVAVAVPSKHSLSQISARSNSR